MAFFCSGPLLAQDPLTISGTYTVADDGTKEEYSNITLDKNTSHLIVDGTLIIYGDLNMNGNDSQLTINEGSIVIVYGNVYAANKVALSAESYFIVYGNFTRKTGSSHGETDFQTGDVYIFGKVDDNWNIDECVDATGSNCDYGDEGDFLEEDLPPEVQEAMNCFDIPQFANNTTCQGQNAIFSLPTQITGAETYQWQEKDINGVWVDRINDTLPTLTIPNVQPAMNGSLYRLVVRSTGGCKMGVSKTVSLTVTSLNFTLGEIQGETETCGETGPFTYLIPEPTTPVTYAWQIPTGWTIQGSSDTNSISVIPGHTSGEIKVTVTNSCGTQIQRSLSVKGLENIWNGSVNNLWEEPLNWDCGVLPTSSTAVIIPLSAVTYPVINEGLTGWSKNISIEAGASLTVLGNYNISGTISGTLDANEGTLIFSGALPQTIPLNAFSGDIVENITITNPTQVTLESAVKVTGVVKTIQGNLVSNGFLTLVSDIDRTALISGSETGNVVGSINLQRFLDPAYGYMYFSSPLKGVTVADFSTYIDLQDPITGFPHFYSYNENREDSFGNDLTGWEAYIAPSMPLDPMEGYAVNFGITGGPLTVTLSGEVNNGPQSRILTNNNGTYTKGFNLVGNPYPSPIDWNQTAGWTKTNIDDAVYFFSASSTDPYTGTYSSYIENGPSSDGKTTSIIPSMQGFFVHVTDGRAQGTLAINNLARVDDQAQGFHKSMEKSISLLRISAGFEKEKMSDPTVIYFNPSAEDSFDKKLDALKLMNTNSRVPSFYSLSPEKKELSINALPASSQSNLVRIPLGYTTQKAGDLIIELQDLENLAPGFQVYLVDLKRNMYIDLQQGNYTTPVSEGSFNNHFELVLSKEAITDPSELLNIPMSVYATKERISVSLNLNPGAQAEIVVTSISGQVLKTLTASAQETVEIKGIKSAGVYIIILVSGETRYSKKILIK